MRAHARISTRPSSRCQRRCRRAPGRCVFVVEALERHKGRYGYRRIDRELRKSGIAVSGKRVLRVMRKLGLAGRGATRKRRIQKKVEPGDPRLNLKSALSP